MNKQEKTLQERKINKLRKLKIVTAIFVLAGLCLSGCTEKESPRGFSVSKSSGSDSQTTLMSLNEISGVYGETAFQAALAIPETRKLLLDRSRFENLSVENYPGPECFEFLATDAGSVRLSSAITDSDTSVFNDEQVKQIGRWVFVFRSFNVLYTLDGFHEDSSMMPLLYKHRLTRPLFSSALKRRPSVPESAFEDLIATTLSTSERREILCEAITELSRLDNARIFKYFSELLLLLTANEQEILINE